MPGLKACMHPGCSALQKGSYCEAHRRTRYVSGATPPELVARPRPKRKDTRRNRPNQRLRNTAAYRSLRVRFLKVWLATYGATCAGYRRSPHVVPVTRLTVDHKVPLEHGGPHAWDNLQVLCTTCNSRKKDNLS